AQRRGGAGGEAGVAAVDRRDAVGGDGQSAGREGDDAAAERAGAQGGGAVLEGDRARGRARARRGGRHRGRERHGLPGYGRAGRGGQRRACGRLVHRLRKRRRRAGREVRVPAVHRGDAVRGHREGGGRDGGLAAAERAGAEGGGAVLERDRAGGRART